MTKSQTGKIRRTENNQSPDIHHIGKYTGNSEELISRILLETAQWLRDERCQLWGTRRSDIPCGPRNRCHSCESAYMIEQEASKAKESK